MRVEWRPSKGGRKPGPVTDTLTEVGVVIIDGDLIRVHPHRGAIEADMPAFTGRIDAALAGGVGWASTTDGLRTWAPVLALTEARAWAHESQRRPLLACGRRQCTAYLDAHSTNVGGDVLHTAVAERDSRSRWNISVSAKNDGPWELRLEHRPILLGDPEVAELISDLTWQMHAVRRLNNLPVEVP